MIKSINPIEMRLKLHDRIVEGYANLQVCLCLDIASKISDPCFDIRRCESFVQSRQARGIVGGARTGSGKCGRAERGMDEGRSRN